MEIQTPAPILMKFFTHIPTCPRKVLVQVWPPPLPLSLGGRPKTLKAEEHIFKMLSRLQINPCSTGYFSSLCYNLVQYINSSDVTEQSYLYKSPAIEVYGHCRLLLPWLRVPCWFLCNLGLKNNWPSWWLNPSSYDLSFQS